MTAQTGLDQTPGKNNTFGNASVSALSTNSPNTPGVPGSGTLAVVSYGQVEPGKGSPTNPIRS
jgi:hypothetical protein